MEIFIKLIPIVALGALAFLFLRLTLSLANISDVPNTELTYDWRFCPQCSKPLYMRLIEGKSRLSCNNKPCSFVHWDNPKPVVCVLVPSLDGGIVLIKHKNDPQGSWWTPGGFQERGEQPQAAAVREVREETGLDIELDGDIVMCRLEEEPNVNIMLFQAKPVDTSKLKAGDDAGDARVFYQVSDEITCPITKSTLSKFFRTWQKSAKDKTQDFLSEKIGKINQLRQSPIGPLNLDQFVQDNSKNSSENSSK